MIRSLLIAFYRTAARHPLYAVLNVLGLAFGIAVFIIISLYVHYEATFDAWMPRAAHIHELSTTNSSRDPKAGPRFLSPGLARDAVQTVLPEARTTRILSTWSIFLNDGEPIEEEEYLADANLFDVFDLQIIAGKKTGALTPDSIVISEAMARKYFGQTDVVGRRFVISDLVSGLLHVPEGASDPRSYTVTAVVADSPPNSTLHFHFIRLLTPQRIAMFRNWDNWESAGLRTFVMLEGPDQTAHLNAKLDAIVNHTGRSPFIESQFPGRPRHEHYQIRAVPLAGEHLTDRKSVAVVMALGTLGVLAFAIALLNYINLATARTIVRAREAALRRTLGATEGELRLQFLGEAALVSVMAVILGFSFVELVLPLVNHLGGTALRLNYIHTWAFLGWMCLAVLMCGAAAGLYPAFLVAAYQPAQVFASTRTPSGGRLTHRLREILVFLQFTLVSAFLIVVLGFTTQLRHLQTSDLGFDRKGLLITNALININVDPGKVSAITSQWVALPNVVSMTSGEMPGQYFLPAQFPITRPGGDGAPIDSDVIMIGEYYFTVLDTPVLAGRGLTQADQLDEITFQPFGLLPTTFNVVINRRAVQAFGFASPQAALGHDLTMSKVKFHIVGVVGDQRLAAPSAPIPPMVYLSLEQMTGKQPTVIKYEGVSEDVMKARMTSVWRTLAPDKPLDLTSGEESLNYYYNTDRRMTRLFVMGACLVALIGGIGLYGMAAFNTSVRGREIGLRKAMGGSQARIALLLVTQFLRPVILANLAAWPLAWMVLDRWFAQFDDRVPLSPWFFAAGSALSILLAIVTVAGLTVRISGASPGKTLRHE